MYDFAKRIAGDMLLLAWFLRHCSHDWVPSKDDKASFKEATLIYNGAGGWH